MRKKHSANLDEEKLEYAVELLTGFGIQKAVIERVLFVMQFGNISIQDMLDFLEAVGT